jgi:hypothetical protein
MAVPYTFGTATAAIPLSQLDSNFATAITIGNTAVYLGNTTSSIGNLSLTNVTLVSVSAPVTPAQGGTGVSALTANNVIIGNGTSNVTFVAPGTTGNVLTSNGTTWTSAAAGGGSAMTLISTQTANASTSITFTGLTTYSKYQIIIENLYGASAPNLFLQLGYGATPTYITSNYQYLDTYAIRTSGGSNVSLLVSSLTDSGVQITASALGPSSYNGMSGVIYITNMLATAGNFKTSGTVFIGGDYNGNGSAVGMSIESISFSNPDTNAKTAIKLYVTSGTMTAKFSLYGISS